MTGLALCNPLVIPNEVKDDERHVHYKLNALFFGVSNNQCVFLFLKVGYNDQKFVL